MALTIGGGSGAGSGILYGRTGSTSSTWYSLHRPILWPSNPSWSLPFTGRNSHIFAAKKFSSRTGRFDSKNKRSATTTKEQEDDQQRTTQIEDEDSGSGRGAVDISDAIDDGYFLPELPGDKPDFWEGPQWDALGFFVQYRWAFGIVFALVACGIAVATYNEGATDFKETPVDKESIQSRELLEEQEASNSDVFESNPTEEAPSLE